MRGERRDKGTAGVEVAISVTSLLLVAFFVIGALTDHEHRRRRRSRGSGGRSAAAATARTSVGAEAAARTVVLSALADRGVACSGGPLVSVNRDASGVATVTVQLCGRARRRVASWVLDPNTVGCPRRSGSTPCGEEAHDPSRCVCAGRSGSGSGSWRHDADDDDPRDVPDARLVRVDLRQPVLGRSPRRAGDSSGGGPRRRPSVSGRGARRPSRRSTRSSPGNAPLPSPQRPGTRARYRCPD